MFRNEAAEFVYVRTYSRWLDDESRRETWPETVDRFVNFIVEERGNLIPKKVIRKIRESMLTFDVMPSMRAVWAAGPAAKADNVCLYNCSFQVIDTTEAFAECLYILMCGTGYGFSVQDIAVEKLPVVGTMHGEGAGTFIVPDSKEGWANSVRELIKALYVGKDLDMDYSLLRPKGARLKTMGGRSSGPAPLINLHAFLRSVFQSAQGRKLTTLECHDICNQIAEIVVVGGVRRSSQISLSDLNDEAMRHAKEWPYPLRRAMANNSAIYLKKPSAVEFLKEWSTLAASGTGERGIFNLAGARERSPSRRNPELIMGTNPCKPLNSLILTQDGYITFEHALKMDSLKVVTDDGSIVDATKPFVTGVQKKVMRILLSNGQWLYGTPDHKHKMYHGDWQSLESMKIGDRLETVIKAVHDTNVNNTDRYNLGMLCGWLWGDGSLYERKDSPNSYRLPLCFGSQEFDVADMFADIYSCKVNPHHQSSLCKVTQITGKWINAVIDEGISFKRNDSGLKTLDKSNLKWILGKDKNFKLGFIRAFFTADGSVRHNGVNALYNTEKEALNIVGLLLNEFGLYSCVGRRGKAKIKGNGSNRRIQKEHYVVETLFSEFEKIGYLSKVKNDLMITRRKLHSIRKPLLRNSLVIKEIDLNYSVETVYDITVDHNSHTFIDSTVKTHNCGEIMLRSKQFCNLSEVVVRAEDDVDTLLEKVETATWIGVIQSTFTYFPYLSKEWKENCEEERLLGVSMTGQMDNVALMNPEVLKALKSKCLKVAKRASQIMEINMPAAITCVKPSGTVSQLVDSASGVHPRYSAHYIRRYRIASTDPLFKMMRDQGISFSPENGTRKSDWERARKLQKTGDPNYMQACPIYDSTKEWSEDLVSTWVVGFPVKAPTGCITRNSMNAIEQLEHYKMLQQYWCEHNASTTIYVKDSEWFEVGNWVYTNWDIVNGVSFLPHDGGHYEQAPYTECTKEEYETFIKNMPKIDYSQLSAYELEDQTEGSKALACASGVCEL